MLGPLILCQVFCVDRWVFNRSVNCQGKCWHLFSSSESTTSISFQYSSACSWTIPLDCWQVPFKHSKHLLCVFTRVRLLSYLGSKMQSSKCSGSPMDCGHNFVPRMRQTFDMLPKCQIKWILDTDLRPCANWWLWLWLRLRLDCHVIMH